MISPAKYASLYDFALVEKAVQDYFCADEIFAEPPGEDDPARESWIGGPDSIAFFTAFEAAMFQKSIPRVACFLTGINPATTPGHAVIDSNGAIRNNLWRGNLVLEIITEQSYTLHTQLRNMVSAMGEMICPMVSNPTLRLGANAYSNLFQLAYCQPQNIATAISQGEGFYGSQLNYQLTFGIPEAAILAIT